MTTWCTGEFPTIDRQALRPLWRLAQRLPFADASVISPPSPADMRMRLVGRRQVVRHRFLVPAFAASNPAAPANHKGLFSRRSYDFASNQSGWPGRKLRIIVGKIIWEHAG